MLTKFVFNVSAGIGAMCAPCYKHVYTPEHHKHKCEDPFPSAYAHHSGKAVCLFCHSKTADLDSMERHYVKHTERGIIAVGIAQSLMNYAKFGRTKTNN